MGHEVLLPHSEVSASSPHPDPDKSISQSHIICLQDTCLYRPHIRLGLSSSLVSSCFLTFYIGLQSASEREDINWESESKV